MDWFVETFVELLFFLACFWMGAFFYETVEKIFQKLYPDVSEEDYLLFFSKRVFDGYWGSIEAKCRGKRG